MAALSRLPAGEHQGEGELGVGRVGGTGDPRLDGGDPAVVADTGRPQPDRQAVDRITAPPRLDLRLVTVAAAAEEHRLGLQMAADPVRARLDERGPPTPASTLDRARGGPPDLDHVVAVDHGTRHPEG